MRCDCGRGAAAVCGSGTVVAVRWRYGRGTMAIRSFIRVSFSCCRFVAGMFTVCCQQCHARCRVAVGLSRNEVRAWAVPQCTHFFAVHAARRGVVAAHGPPPPTPLSPFYPWPVTRRA
eukprot:350645-Chlamydomonas_euryale.AAC.2